MTLQERALAEHAELMNKSVAWAFRKVHGTACIVGRDDLLQHARLALLKARDEFDGRGTFEAFASQRMRWALIDAIRDVGPTGCGRPDPARASLTSKVRMRSLEDGEADGLAGASEDPIAGIERERLRAMVDKLPARLRRIVTEYHFEDKNHREISISLGVNESRVCQLHKRALGCLRALIEGKSLPISATEGSQSAREAREALSRVRRMERGSESSALRISSLEKRLAAVERQLAEQSKAEA